MPFGTFVKRTVVRRQSNNKNLQYFIEQMIDDAIKTSSIPTLAGAKVVPTDLYANQAKLNESCLITVSDDMIDEDDSRDKLKTTKTWTKFYTIRMSIDNTPGNQDLIKQIHDELRDLLTLNDGPYSNTAPGTITETYSNRPLHNLLIEEQILYEGDNQERPSYLTSILSIRFHITQ